MELLDHIASEIEKQWMIKTTEDALQTAFSNWEGQFHTVPLLDGR
jgi:hypothetical protein